MIKKRFVELFDLKQGGFNYLAFIGIVLGISTSWLLRNIYLPLDQNYFSISEYGGGPDIIKFLGLDYFFRSLIYFIVLAFIIVGLSSFLKKDWQLIVLAGSVGFVYNIIEQIIINKYLTPSQNPQDLPLLDIYWMIDQIIWFMILTSVIIFVFRLTQRLDVSLILGFPIADLIASIISSLVYMVRSFIEYSEYYTSDDIHQIAQTISYNIRFLPSTLFIGVLFYWGYILHRKIKKLEPVKAFLGYPVNKNISRKFYYGSWLISGIICLCLLIIIVHLTWYTEKLPELQIWFIPSILILFAVEIFAVVVLYMLIYRMWKYIPQNLAEGVTPAKAVGFLFIPFFNFYWFFVVLVGYAKRYNRIIEQNNLSIPILSAGWFLFVCIFHLFVFVLMIPSSIIPEILWSYLIHLVLIHLFVLILTISIICDSINHLPVNFNKQ